ncbi:hypothetical protein HJC23_002943 [Cyclotella cryptica]|uniref:Dynein regulatory complex protein 10 n=1 Tax=Cyclotella cryptica TaxID=29204 RepID=A0ABD3PQU2_9STRA|eukprot:CCRYP_012454-RA/>CCRYP_012454-RA protein AED:0.12 eAED:0.12 QI:0/-1/0/1/-1/1/1/0/301
MQRVNAEYASRVASAFDNATFELRNEECPIDASSTPLNLQIADEFELLKSQVVEILSLTYEEEQELRSDILKFDCETATKSEDLARCQRRLRFDREDRQERRDELENELLALNKVLEDKLSSLKKGHELELVRELEQEELDWQLFNEEMNAMQTQREELRRQLQEQKENHAKVESALRDGISLLTLNIENVSAENKAIMSAKEKEVETLQSILEQQKKRRCELEEHFAKVDENNAAKKREEEALQRVADISKRARELLDNGAVQLQRIFRGKRDRALVAKLKSKSNKKGGKSKRKKGGKKK